MKSLSLVRLLATPWTAAHQAPPSMGFSRQEYWSGVPLPSPLIVTTEILLCARHSISLQTSTHLIFICEVASICTEKAIAPHSSTLAWKIPWMEEPGGPQSMGSLRVRQDSATSLSLFTFMHWRRKRQPTPVFLPGESQGWGSLVGCHLWGHTESDMTEVT